MVRKNRRIMVKNMSFRAVLNLTRNTNEKDMYLGK